MRVAVMDLGSSSFQLLVADVDRRSRIRPVRRTRVILNLGIAAASSTEVPPDMLMRARSTLRSFSRQAIEEGAELVLAVATSALREADDRHAVGRTLSEAAGTEVRFLSGDEEAMLSYTGIRAGIGRRGSVLALDLGGGSLEAAVGNGHRPMGVASAPLGAGRLTGSFASRERLGSRERRTVEATIQRWLDEPTLGEVLGASAAITAACGGTVRSLARIILIADGADRAAVDAHVPGAEISLGDLESLTDELWEMPLRDRRSLPGVAARRAPLLPAGALVLTRTLQHTGRDGLVISGWGLREGCILEAISHQLAA